MFAFCDQWRRHIDDRLSDTKLSVFIKQTETKESFQPIVYSGYMFVARNYVERKVQERLRKGKRDFRMN